MKGRQYIKLVFTRSSGHRTEAKIKWPFVSDGMMRAAEELLQMMTTGIKHEAKQDAKRAKRK